MNSKFGYTFFLLFSIWFSSCDRPECSNENLIFENNAPNSKVYKDELVKQLGGIDETKLTYWLQKYEEKSGEESLYFHIQGDSLCAILQLSMPHWTKLEEVKEKKGVGRRGAEFTNLKFDILQDSVSTKFIYRTFDRLID
ncbi:hypothetical protein [Maribacter sp. 2308TA10-17]|uniref:hypothetical protein n=1 Tax=Maribacter sp. 2308TA10-17 TaxID=3386276 RepID=UPI0039BD2D59